MPATASSSSAAIATPETMRFIDLPSELRAGGDLNPPRSPGTAPGGPLLTREAAAAARGANQPPETPAFSSSRMALQEGRDWSRSR